MAVRHAPVAVPLGLRTVLLDVSEILCRRGTCMQRHSLEIETLDSGPSHSH